MLRDDGFVAADCSSDPVSGDLAVTSYSLGSSARNNVAVYAPGTSKPRRLFYAALNHERSLRIRRSRKSFRGRQRKRPACRACKGGRALETIALDSQLVRPGGLEWDGRDPAIEQGGFAEVLGDLSRAGRRREGHDRSHDPSARVGESRRDLRNRWRRDPERRGTARYRRRAVELSRRRASAQDLSRTRHPWRFVNGVAISLAPR